MQVLRVFEGFSGFSRFLNVSRAVLVSSGNTRSCGGWA